MTAADGSTPVLQEETAGTEEGFTEDREGSKRGAERTV
jgi:hypothetical protein